MRPEALPAIAFVDLSGFTRLSQELGDDRAARIALRLGELSAGVAQRHDGRLVKLLGDGALLRFRSASSAVTACLELLDAIPDAGLPAAHAGVDAGPVVSRDGDVFGRTVNSASRLSDLAGPDEVLLPWALAETLPGLQLPIEAVGPVQIPGIGERRLARVRRRGSSAAH
jgi:class 3 adenylate cyclase